MDIPHKALVLVADGAKMLLLRNEGTADHLQLRVEQHARHDDPADRDLKSDAAGAASSSQSGGNSMDEPDYHQQAEDRFALRVSELVNNEALTGNFGAFVVVAAPRMLGALRPHYHPRVAARLVAEIGKDLVNQPVPDIEQALLAA